MLLRVGGRGAVKAGLGVGDELDGDRRHQRLEPPLGDEALAEARIDEVILELEPETARDDHAGRAMGQREVARDRAKAEAEPVERGDGKAVLALERQRPDFLVVEAVRALAFDLGERLIDRDDARPSDDAFGGDAGVGRAQPLDDRVLDRVERGDCLLYTSPSPRDS